MPRAYERDDSGWTLLGTGLPWRASENSVFHFFRVTVEMR
jgi:hypothetical protein